MEVKGSSRSTFNDMAANRSIDLALRLPQIIFAVIVMGTDGYAIHGFRGHTVYEHFEFGSFYNYKGIPNAWGFLLFCAGWTFLGAIFLLLVRGSLGHQAWAGWLGYTCVAVEGVALFSWLAGFVAAAVSVVSNTCSEQEHGCDSITAATIFGALEWLLFVITAAMTTKLVVNNSRWRGGPATTPNASV